MTQAPSAATVEQEIVAARARLEGTVNELAYRAQPKVIAQRQVADIKQKIHDATHTPSGDLRVDRIAMAAGAVVALVVVSGLLRRRRG